MRRNRVSLVSVAALAVATAACDGSGLLSLADGATEQPRILAVEVPEFVRPNDVLDVRIRATAPEGITAVLVTFIEDAVRERRLTIEPPALDVNEFTQFQVPGALVRTSVFIRAQVEDRLGARSTPFEVEIPVIRPAGT